MDFLDERFASVNRGMYAGFTQQNAQRGRFMGLVDQGPDPRFSNLWGFHGYAAPGPAATPPPFSCPPGKVKEWLSAPAPAHWICTNDNAQWQEY